MKHIRIKLFDLCIDGLYISYQYEGQDFTIDTNPAETAQLLLDAELIKDYNSYNGILYLSPLGLEVTPDETGSPLDTYFNPKWSWDQFYLCFEFDETHAFLLAKHDILNRERDEKYDSIRNLLAIPSMIANNINPNL